MIFSPMTGAKITAIPIGSRANAPSVPAPAQVNPNAVQRIVTAGLMLLNDDRVEQHLIELIKGSQNPAQGIAQALVFLLRTLKERSKAMPMAALGQASQQILAEILKMAEAAHVIQVTPELLQQVIQAVKVALTPQPQKTAVPQVAPRAQAFMQGPSEAAADVAMAAGFHKAAPKAYRRKQANPMKGSPHVIIH